MKRTIALTAAVLAALAVGTAPAWASDGDQAACDNARTEQASWREIVAAIESGEASPPPTLEDARASLAGWTGDVEKFCVAGEGDETPDETTAPPTTTPDDDETTAPPTTEPTTEPDPTTDPTPTTQPTTADPEPEPERVFFRSCRAVRAADALPLLRGEDGYRRGLDRDRDGVACEREDFDRDHEDHDHDGRDRDHDDDNDGDDDSDSSNDGSDGQDGEDGADGQDGADGVTTVVTTSDNSNSGSVAVPTGGVATGVGPAEK